MTPEKEILLKYADIKGQISILEDQIEELKPQVEGIILSLNPEDKTVATEFGVFSMVPKRKYTYTEDLQVKEKEIKEAKKNQEATGEATYVEEPYLKYSNKTTN